MSSDGARRDLKRGGREGKRRISPRLRKYPGDCTARYRCEPGLYRHCDMSISMMGGAGTVGCSHDERVGNQDGRSRTLAGEGWTVWFRSPGNLKDGKSRGGLTYSFRDADDSERLFR